MSMEPVATGSFSAELEAIFHTHPRLYQNLKEHHDRRISVLKKLRPGVRLNGLEQLVSYLEELVGAWANDKKLQSISPLLKRALSDCIAIIEAVLVDEVSIASDCSRDLMEIELLLKDFALEPERINEWLTADDKTIQNQYSPGPIRKRLHAASVPPFEESDASNDYKAHSKMLHITPTGFRLNSYLSALSTIFTSWDDTGLFEIFFHAEGVVNAAWDLAVTYAEDIERVPSPGGLEDFRKASNSVGEMADIRYSLLTKMLAMSTESVESS